MARTPDPDDAALRWDDVDDASYLTSADDPDHPDETGADETGADEREAEVARAHDGSAPQGSSGGSILTIVAAVLYGAYTIAWVVGVGRIPLTGPTLALEIAYQFAEFLAIVSSALWFAATVVMTRGRPRHRAGWLALGALVLLPWPFIIGVIA